MQKIKTIFLIIYTLPTMLYYIFDLVMNALKVIKEAKKNNEPTVNFTETLLNFMNKIDENRDKLIHINGIIWILIVLLIFK